EPADRPSHRQPRSLHQRAPAPSAAVQRLAPQPSCAAAADPAPGTTAGPGRILSRQMVLVLIAAVGALSGFYLLLSVVPLYAAGAGAGGLGAGLATGAMMLSAVLLELAVPRLAGRLGYRAVMALGLILLGVPAATLATSPALPLVLLASLARGARLGIVVVGGAALAAGAGPAERRGA